MLASVTDAGVFSAFSDLNSTLYFVRHLQVIVFHWNLGELLTVHDVAFPVTAVTVGAESRWEVHLLVAVWLDEAESVHPAGAALSLTLSHTTQPSRFPLP